MFLTSATSLPLAENSEPDDDVRFENFTDTAGAAPADSSSQTPPSSAPSSPSPPPTPPLPEEDLEPLPLTLPQKESGAACVEPEQLDFDIKIEGDGDCMSDFSGSSGGGSTISSSKTPQPAKRMKLWSATSIKNSKKYSSKSDGPAEEGPKIGLIVVDERFAGADSGLVVKSVTKDLPAWKAGILKGDIILMVGGTRTKRVREFPAISSGFRWGQAVSVILVRKHEKIPISIRFD